ncbi:alpha/beta hydrolase [Nocardioides ungokensis]|uniref:alpha/beta hydrolase n=1 Tax=Nocardioides ungokensis TaxID=1643322 RepID=UPI0015DE2C0F|nr:alpha/beta hydrolase [Nocardioides ungokensis]
MGIHEAVASRFHLLDGIASFEQLMGDPALEERFHAFMQHRDAAPAPDTTTYDTTAPGPHGPVPVRVYGDTSAGGNTGRPCLVWHHGGAFVMGDLDMPEADRVAREIAVRADAVVVSVDYRLAIGPVTYPVPLDDCVAAVRWVRERAGSLGVDAGRISVGGASAGANLATAATLRLRYEDAWLPAALLAAYGVFHPELPPAGRALAARMDEVPGLLRFRPAAVAGFNANYVGGPATACDGYAMPALADLAGLCPVLLANAEYDDLRSSGESFAAALGTAGVDVQQVVARGVLHGFLNLPAEVDPVGRVLDLMAAAVAATPASIPHPVPVS